MRLLPLAMFVSLAAPLSATAQQVTGWSLPATAKPAQVDEYRIGPLDKLNITVFQAITSAGSSEFCPRASSPLRFRW